MLFPPSAACPPHSCPWSQNREQGLYPLDVCWADVSPQTTGAETVAVLRRSHVSADLSCDN